MFRNFIEKLKELAEGPEIFIPSKLNDPIAEQIGWNRISKVTNCSYKLFTKDSETVEFKIDLKCKSFPFFALLILLHILRPSDVFWTLVFLAIILIISIVYYFITAPIIFSKTMGLFCKGRNLNKIKGYFRKRENSNQSSEDNTCEKQIPFEQIYAIQLIPVKHTGGKVSSISYELNLVLKNKERANVIHNSEVRHDVKKQIRKDAESLSHFLGVPLWDTLDYKIGSPAFR